jgi:hypothetical protein
VLSPGRIVIFHLIKVNLGKYYIVIKKKLKLHGLWCYGIVSRVSRVRYNFSKQNEIENKSTLDNKLRAAI